MNTEWFTKSAMFLLDKYFDNIIIKASKNGIYLVAHSDTVFPCEPKEEEVLECRGIFTAPQNGLGADDRVGLWTVERLIKIFPDCGFIISPDEETGDITLNTRIKEYSVFLDDAKLFISFDRKGMSEYVDYGNYNKKIEKYLKALGIKRNHGTYSTVSMLSDKFYTACVNLCICADNFHEKAEWWDSNAYEIILEKYIKFISWAQAHEGVFEQEKDPDKHLFDYGCKKYYGNYYYFEEEKRGLYF